VRRWQQSAGSGREPHRPTRRGPRSPGLFFASSTRARRSGKGGSGAGFKRLEGRAPCIHQRIDKRLPLHIGASTGLLDSADIDGRQEARHVIYADYIAGIAPSSPTDVIEEQNSDDVPTASVETIRALYHRLYRPKNMMVVIVGNVDPTTAKALIAQRFGIWKRIRSPVVHVPVPRLRYDRLAPISFSALLQGRRTALITVAMPTLSLRGSIRSQMDAELMDRLAIRAINSRLGSAQPGSPSGKVGMFIENGEQGHRLIMLWDNFTAMHGSPHWPTSNEPHADWVRRASLRTNGTGRGVT